MAANLLNTVIRYVRIRKPSFYFRSAVKALYVVSDLYRLSFL